MPPKGHFFVILVALFIASEELVRQHCFLSGPFRSDIIRRDPFRTFFCCFCTSIDKDATHRAPSFFEFILIVFAAASFQPVQNCFAVVVANRRISACCQNCRNKDVLVESLRSNHQRRNTFKFRAQIEIDVELGQYLNHLGRVLSWAFLSKVNGKRPPEFVISIDSEAMARIGKFVELQNASELDNGSLVDGVHRLLPVGGFGTAQARGRAMPSWKPIRAQTRRLRARQRMFSSVLLSF